jgi:hypothetical protein
MARFALFGEVLLVGVWVLLLALPVLTLLPAVAAGVRHLRRFVEGTDRGFAGFREDVVAACRGVWLVSGGSVVVLAVIALDLWAVSTGALPGGALVGVVGLAVGVALLVVLLRAAGLWVPGRAWWPVVQDGAREASTDVVGTALLVAALGVCGLLVWMLPPFLVVVGGLLSFAVVSVEVRRASRG